MTEVKFVVRNLDAVNKFLKELPRGSLRVGLRSLTEYLLGDKRHGLRHYEPYKYVKPFRSYSLDRVKAARLGYEPYKYVKRFRSYPLDRVKAARQRRWIFAHLDIIGKNNRTGNTSAAWEMKETNNGYGFTLSNASKGAGWIWGDKTQTRHQKAVGHRTISSKIASNLKGAIRQAVADVKKWIAEKKPKA